MATRGRSSRENTPIRVLVGRNRFSDRYGWKDMAEHFPDDLGRVEIQSCDPGELLKVLTNEPDWDVICPAAATVGIAELHAGRFGLVQQFGAGLDSVDIDAASKAGVWVANLPGYNAPSVAEHAILLLLAAARRTYDSEVGFLPGNWGLHTGRAIGGTTVCIVGLGAVGANIATRLQNFGVHITAVRDNPKRGVPAGLGFVELRDSLDEALIDADALILTATFSPARGPLLDVDAFTRMKRGVLIVNVSRGGLIDEQALLDALNSGIVESAGLDVFVREPNPNPLLADHPHVIATAHVAATTDAFFRAGSLGFADALARYRKGEPPADVVNHPVQPRSHFVRAVFPQNTDRRCRNRTGH